MILRDPINQLSLALAPNSSLPSDTDLKLRWGLSARKGALPRAFIPKNGKDQPGRWSIRVTLANRAVALLSLRTADPNIAAQRRIVVLECALVHRLSKTDIQNYLTQLTANELTPTLHAFVQVAVEGQGLNVGTCCQALKAFELPSYCKKRHPGYNANAKWALSTIAKGILQRFLESQGYGAAASAITKAQVDLVPLQWFTRLELAAHGHNVARLGPGHERAARTNTAIKQIQYLRGLFSPEFVRHLGRDRVPASLRQALDAPVATTQPSAYRPIAQAELRKVFRRIVKSAASTDWLAAFSPSVAALTGLYPTDLFRAPEEYFDSKRDLILLPGRAPLPVPPGTVPWLLWMRRQTPSPLQNLRFRLQATRAGNDLLRGVVKASHWAQNPARQLQYYGRAYIAAGHPDYEVISFFRLRACPKILEQIARDAPPKSLKRSLENLARQLGAIAQKRESHG